MSSNSNAFRIEEIIDDDSVKLNLNNTQPRILIQDITMPSSDSLTSKCESIAESAEPLNIEHRNAVKKYSFRLLEGAKLNGFNNKEIQENLFKWGMQEHCYLKRFSYDQYLNPLDIDNFLLEFFNDPNVNGHIKVLGTMDRWGSLGKVERVVKEETLHSVTSLTFFDRLTQEDGQGIVRPDGSIRKCLDEYHEGFLIGDELRKCLLMKEHESFDLFSNQDRREFVFHLFKALCLGGRLCQYEDDIEPYLESTRKLYKDLISVTKDASTGKLQVASLVYKILHLESALSPLFPISHPQNFCYVSIDPIKRHVNVFYHASDAYY